MAQNFMIDHDMGIFIRINCLTCFWSYRLLSVTIPEKQLGTEGKIEKLKEMILSRKVDVSF